MTRKREPSSGLLSTQCAGAVVSAFGYVIVTFAVLSALKVNLAGLLLGGALTGVVIGIAAQQTLGNFFAGLVLLMIRPFAVGAAKRRASIRM